MQKLRELKKGDIVHVRAVVDDPLDGDGDVALVVKGATINDCDIWCAPSEVVHVEPRAMQVGDLVTWGTRVSNWTILAVDGDTAWIKSATSEWRQDMKLADLERA